MSFKFAPKIRAIPCQKNAETLPLYSLINSKQSHSERSEESPSPLQLSDNKFILGEPSGKAEAERSEESPRHYSLFDFYNCALEMTGICVIQGDPCGRPLWMFA